MEIRAIGIFSHTSLVFYTQPDIQIQRLRYVNLLKISGWILIMRKLFGILFLSLLVLGFSGIRPSKERDHLQRQF